MSLASVIRPEEKRIALVCINYCRRKKATVKDTYALDCIDESTGSLQSAKIFKTLYTNSNYQGFRIGKDRNKAVFVCQAGQHRYKRAPFGVANAPVSFQRTFGVILPGFQWETCLVCLNNAIVFLNSG